MDQVQHVALIKCRAGCSSGASEACGFDQVMQSMGSINTVAACGALETCSRLACGHCNETFCCSDNLALTVLCVLQIQSFYEGCPELCLGDDAAVRSIPYTNHVYKRLAQTISDRHLCRQIFELLKVMLHPDPVKRPGINAILASQVFAVSSKHRRAGLLLK